MCDCYFNLRIDDKVSIHSSVIKDYFIKTILDIRRTNTYVYFICEDSYMFYYNKDNGFYFDMNDIAIAVTVSERKEEMKTSTNLVENFKNLFVKEPQKTFRSLGITDNNDILTDEGQKIFLSYLLHNKFSEDFKKEIVDLIK